MTDSLRDRLWQRMAEIYGHRWTASYGADPATGAGPTWAKGLSGLSAGHIAQGVEACLVSAEPWPPTLPEFRALCLGVPSLASVRADREKATPFTRLVWQHLDGYAYRHATTDKADRMLREAYEAAREHVMRGGVLPEPPVADLAHEKHEFKPASPECVEAAHRKIAETLGVKP